MVFEGYVVELVNKFAGQYLDNLDPSQLKLGIWGGKFDLISCVQLSCDQPNSVDFCSQLHRLHSFGFIHPRSTLVCWMLIIITLPHFCLVRRCKTGKPEFERECARKWKYP